ILHTMYYQDEIRQVEQFGKEHVQIREAELKVAEQLVEALASKWDPSKYHDTFEENLKTLIRAKLEGKEVTPVEKPRPAPVVDLMAALKQSLEQMQAKKPAQRVREVEEAERARKPSDSGRERRKPRRIGSYKQIFSGSASGARFPRPFTMILSS